jgi:hypothetical protein
MIFTGFLDCQDFNNQGNQINLTKIMVQTIFLTVSLS